MSMKVKKIIGNIYYLMYRAIKNNNYLSKKANKLRKVVGRVFPSIAAVSDSMICKGKVGDLDSFNDLDSIQLFEEYELIDNLETFPLVSVIVPNFNHSKFLRERLESIYNQSYKNIEVILLDDCSTDDSCTILKEYYDKYPDSTRLYINEKNSGQLNLQWKKGIELATGKYLWIAESDDWCELDFLEKMIPQMSRRSVMLSFCRSVFMKNGKKIWSTEEYLCDTKINWNSSFVMSMHEAVEKGFGYYNFVPNVSSAVFRNIKSVSDQILELWPKVKLCGDWLFYLDLCKGGAISYVHDATNYYRIHDNSTSLNVQATEQYYKEHAIVAKYIAHNYKVDSEVFVKHLKVLEQHFIHNNPNKKIETLDQYFPIDDILLINTESRTPNVMICNYSMNVGGGEILPIHLANELSRMGVPVTLVDCNYEQCDYDVVDMVDDSVPLFRMKTPGAIDLLTKSFGTEVIHSHNAVVDRLIALFKRNKDIAHVITLHGMYEAIRDRELKELLPDVCEECDIFCYIAEKNLIPFKNNNCYDEKKFILVNNGVRITNKEKISKTDLGIPEDAFVFCLVSRARFDKGWVEATKAVIQANTVSKREIHLILIGEGEAYNYIKKHYNDRHIHLMGKKMNPCDYYACSDMGLFPSYFAGESVPLAVIECLVSGKPVVASNTGEIARMMTSTNEKKAGVLFELDEGNVKIDKLAQIINIIENDKKNYNRFIELAISAGKKFSIEAVSREYLKIYLEIRKTC